MILQLIFDNYHPVLQVLAVGLYVFDTSYRDEADTHTFFSLASHP